MLFRRKLVKIKDNRLIERLEKNIGKAEFPSSRIELNPKELHALRYNFGELKVNIRDYSSIQKISINELFSYEESSLISEECGFDCKNKTLFSNCNWVSLLNQRLILIDKTYQQHSTQTRKIKFYIPTSDDNVIHFHADDEGTIKSFLSIAYTYGHIDFLIVGGIIDKQSKFDFSKEIFAFTKYKIGNSTIILHYVP